MSMLRLTLSVITALALAGCGSDRLASEGPATAASDPTARPEAVSVSLWHCGVEPVQASGRLWEAPSQTVDDDPGAPLDATNTPTDWVGWGEAVVSEDRMTYTDQGGEVVDFIPDDGIQPPPCA